MGQWRAQMEMEIKGKNGEKIASTLRDGLEQHDFIQI